MNLGRSGASACVADQFIYIAGGNPLEQVGQSMERYSFENDVWTILNVKFPIAMLNFGIAPIAPGQLGIISGRFTNKIFLLESLGENRFKLSEGEELGDNLETMYAIAYRKESQSFYVCNGRTPYEMPKIVECQINKFFKPPEVKPAEKVFTLKLPDAGVRNSNRHLLKLEEFDLYI